MVATIHSPGPDQSPPDDQKPGEPQLRRSWLKLIAVATAVAILLAIVYFSPLQQYLRDLRQLSAQIRGFGPLAPLVLAGSVATLVAAGFPRSIFAVVAGMALGFWPGLFWAQLGTLLGNYVLFVIIRSLGLRDWGRRLLQSRGNFNALLQQRGTAGVVLARQIPLPGLLINVGCALLPVRHVDFLVGTILGQLPQAIPFTLIGAGLIQSSFRKSISVIGLAVALSIIAWIFLRYAFRRPKPPFERKAVAETESTRRITNP